LRLYSADDLARVQAMQQHLAQGFAAAEAAALVTQPAATEPALDSAAARAELDAALANFDESHAQALIDSLLAQLSIDTILDDVVLPYLHGLGDRWERGEASIAEEHFASSLLRGRLLGLARGWSRGVGPLALLACAPGEQHDLGLIAFGLALRTRGWRIVYLGPDTPLESVAEAARSSEPAFVIVSSVNPRSFRRRSDEVVKLARETRLCLGGAGAAAADVDSDVLRLTGGPVDEADALTELSRR